MARPRTINREVLAGVDTSAVTKATSGKVKPKNAQRTTPAAARTASPEIAIRGFLSKYDPAIARQLRACRRTIRACVPRGYELVYDNHNALVFGFSPSERTSDALLSIAGYPRWVTLFLLKGATLSDPDGLLHGEGSQVRGLKLGAPADLDAAQVRALIARALAPAAKAFAAAPPLRTIVKSVSAKQRPRRPA